MKDIERRSRHARWQTWLPIIAVSIGLAGCVAPFQPGPPGPDTPRISNLAFTPTRLTAGCPVTIRFQFQDPHGDVRRPIAHWTLQQSNKRVASDYLLLPVDPVEFAGKTSGEASARLTLDRYGTYWYHVQVEDAGGNKSNVLRAAVLIDAPPLWAKNRKQCEEPS